MQTKNLTDAEKADAVREHERQTTGSNQLHRHPLGITYTDGVRFLAETCGAFWLIDAVASHQPPIRRKKGADAASFQVWRLEPERQEETDGWALSAWTDTPKMSQRLAYQWIEFSDFPRELAPFEFYCESGTMLLKGER